LIYEDIETCGSDFINSNKPDDIKDNERMLSENPSDSALSYNNALYARDYYGKEDILKRKQLGKIKLFSL
jgi:hypothetical protein